MEDFGILALLPPILAIVMAMWTKQTVLSLFTGVLIGSIMMSGWNPLLGLINTIGEYIIPNMGDSWNASVLLLLIFIGPFALALERGGGATAFADALTHKVTTKKQGNILSWIGGVAIFFSDSSNPVIVGPVFKPITDRLKISREKLAYTLDSTSATIPALLPFTAWGAYVVGVINNHFTETNTTANAVTVFAEGIPYQFYTIGAIIAVLIFAFTGKDFGPMKRAEDRAIKGQVMSDTSDVDSLEEIKMPEGANPTIWNMLLPVIVLIGVVIGMFLWTGGFPEVGVLEALRSGNSMLSLCFAFFIAGLVAIGMSVKSKVFTNKEAGKLYIKGVEQMVEALLVLILAWSLGSVSSDVGTSGYIVSITENLLTPTSLLLVTFIAAAFTAFTTGTSWGTFAIFIPIAVSLAVAVDAPIGAAVGAAMSGGVFGDHCSPISDTTILSSMGASCHHIDHVKTQLPYALMTALAASVGYIIAGFTGGPILGLVVMLVLIFTFIQLGGKYEDRRSEKLKEATE